MLDAFGYNQINSKNAKNLEKLTKKSIFGKVQSLFAYRGIQPTIFSGVYPKEHGIWLDYYFDSKNSSFKWITNSIFPSLESIKNKIPNSYLKKVMSYPICLTSKLLYNYSQFPRSTLIPWNQLKHFKFSMTKDITEYGVLQPYPTLFDYFKQKHLSFDVIDFPWIHSDLEMLKKFKKSFKDSFRKDFYFFRFFDLDSCMHKHGISSSSVIKEMIKVDKYLKYMLDSIEKKVKDFYLLIFSDHGMMNVDKIINPYILINDIKQSIDDKFQYFIDSIMIRFKCREKTTIKKIQNKLRNNKNGKILTQSLKEEKFVDIEDNKYGDVIFILDKGKLFLPNYFQGKSKIKGMHGYLELDTNLNPFILLYNKDLQPVSLKNNLDFIDILPTILDIYGISPKVKYKGQSLLNLRD